MSLRLRLIVAFFFLSVVPLAAVTLYTYASNAAALREAAGHEAQSLAGDLSQRMQLVTAQISDRVEHLMDVQREAEAQAAAPVRTAAAAHPPAPVGTAAATPDKPVPTTAESIREDSVAAALGEVAMLLNNIELKGVRQGGPPPGGGPGGEGRGGGGRGFRGGGRRGEVVVGTPLPAPSVGTPGPSAAPPPPPVTAPSVPPVPPLGPPPPQPPNATDSTSGGAGSPDGRLDRGRGR